MDRRQFLGAGVAGVAAACGSVALTTTVNSFAANAELPDADLFAEARKHFLFPTDVTYCNTGTLGASPHEVVNALTEGLRRLESTLPDWPYFQADGEPLTGYQEMRALRSEVGSLINAGPDEIALTQNATMGMSFIAGGLKLQPGDEVLTTDQEHSGGIGGWRLRARRSGIVVRELNLDAALGGGPEAVLQMFADAVTEKTRVFMFSQITSQFGIVLPAVELCELARERGILSVVDGAQAIGQIPVNVQALDCDAFVASPHKWLLAPKGTGFMYLRNDIQDRIWSTLASSKFEDYEAGAFRFMQYGTGSVPISEGLQAALVFMKKLGIERVSAWDIANNRRLRDGLKAISGARLSSPADDRFAAAITTFRVEGVGARELQNALWEREKVRVRAQGDDKGVRLCCHLYVSPGDVDRVLAVVRSLA